MLVGERPLAQAVKSFERADPITLPFISPESKFDPGNLIGRLKKRFLKGLLLVKCAMILAKPVLLKCENKRLRMSIKGDWRRHGSEVVIRWCQRFFFSPLRDSAAPLNSVAPNEKKTSGTQGKKICEVSKKLVTKSWKCGTPNLTILSHMPGARTLHFAYVYILLFFCFFESWKEHKNVRRDLIEVVILKDSKSHIKAIVVCPSM